MSTTANAVAGALVCALATGVVLAGRATAVSSDATVGATRQRVAITVKCLPYGDFVLAPLQTGALTGDLGTSSTSYPDPHVLVRDGQKSRIYAAIITWWAPGER